MATHPEPVDPVDEELRAVLQHPEVRRSLDDFERRRDAGLVGDGIPHRVVRKLLGLPAVGDSEPEP